MTKAGEKLIRAGKDAVVVAGCDHDAEQIHDPRKPFGFEAWSCKKCGAKFYIPRGEAV